MNKTGLYVLIATTLASSTAAFALPPQHANGRVIRDERMLRIQQQQDLIVQTQNRLAAEQNLIGIARVDLANEKNNFAYLEQRAAKFDVKSNHMAQRCYNAEDREECEAMAAALKGLADKYHAEMDASRSRIVNLEYDINTRMATERSLIAQRDMAINEKARLEAEYRGNKTVVTVTTSPGSNPAPRPVIVVPAR